MIKHVCATLAALAVSSAALAQEGAAPAPQLLNVTASGDATFAGEGTDHTFPSTIEIKARGEVHRLDAVGSGMRKKLIIKVYEGVAYAEAGTDFGSDPYQTLIDGDFPKRIEMYFVHDVDGGKIRGAFEDGFKKTISEKAMTPALKADVDAFLAAFTDDGVKDGQTIALTWMPGMGLYTRIAGRPVPPINDQALANALWAIWFGADPVNDGLKRDMVRFVTGAGGK